MAEYSYNEIMKMQNDAIRRVNEMQQRAKNVVESIKETNNTKDEAHNTKAPERIKMPNDYLDELKNFASTSSYFENEKASAEKNAIEEARNNAPQKELNKSPAAQPDFLKKFFGDFSMDNDKALILSLVLLLTEEKADEMLILSLLYILS